MSDPQPSGLGIPLDPRLRLLKPARMVLDQYAIAEAGEAGADDTEAGRMAQRIEDAIGHRVTDLEPTPEWQERVAAWEASVAADREALARVRALHAFARDHRGNPRCATDKHTWPCLTAVAAGLT